MNHYCQSYPRIWESLTPELINTHDSIRSARDCAVAVRTIEQSYPQIRETLSPELHNLVPSSNFGLLPSTGEEVLG
jgi:hypothetical protein